jgi:hypothetical protein
MNLKTKLLALAGLAVIGTAMAGSAHYVRGPNASLGSPEVTVTWKAAGLGDTTLVEYRADATGNARYQCVNHGGRCPAASNKQNVTGAVSAFGAFASGKNGTITGSLTIDPPASTLNCPGSQVAALVSANFTNIRLSDLTNGALDVPTTPSSLAFAGPECP